MVQPPPRACSNSEAIAQRKTRRGFSLIEAAIVLGEVGLVIGGIWYAAASVQSNMRVNETASGILQIAQGVRRVFGLNSYPTTNGTQWYITSSVLAAGIAPPDFKAGNGGIITPMGTVLNVILVCLGASNSSQCPAMLVDFYGNSELTSSECVQLIRKIGGLAQQTDLVKVQVGTTTNSNYFAQNSPFDVSLFSCPSDMHFVAFWFKP